jgi:hypothetical protein
MKSYRLRQHITVPTIEISFKTTKDLDFNDTSKLRGFIGRLFSENILLHNHDNESVRYTYPRVQYKIMDFHAVVIGLAEGIEALRPLAQLDRIIIGHEDIQIEDFQIIEDQSRLGILKEPIPYSFLSPWLALNEKNYEQYQKLGTWAKKKELLEKILIGNIISMSKSLGYTVPEPIKANIISLKEVQTRLKGTPMLGFLGTFLVNFEIPDYWGIGKSVSRGFGTVVRQRTDIQNTEHR